MQSIWYKFEFVSFLQKKQGIEDSDSGGEEEQGSASKGKGKSRSHGAPGDLPPSESEESYSDDDDDDDDEVCVFLLHSIPLMDYTGKSNSRQGNSGNLKI